MKEFTTIIRSIETEKSSEKQAKGRYTFKVAKNATKVDVKKAVKALYGVDANKVTIMIVPSKRRMVRRGRELIKRPLFKKATVSLKGDKTIDPNKITTKK